MKVDIVEYQKNDFVPVVLKIIIQNQDELLSLWHMLNMTGSEVNKTINHDMYNYYLDTNVSSTTRLWESVNKIVDEYGIKK